MNNDQKPKFFCQKTLSWFLGFLGCSGLVYFFALAGATEKHLPSIAAFIGAIYFLYKIASCAKRVILEKNPEIKRISQEAQEKTKHVNLFAPTIITIMFGPVLWFVFSLMFRPTTQDGQLALIFGSLFISFVGVFLWFNKKT